MSLISDFLRGLGYDDQVEDSGTTVYFSEVTKLAVVRKVIKIMDAKWITTSKGSPRLVSTIGVQGVCVHGMLLDDSCDDCDYDAMQDSQADVAEEIDE